MDGVIEAWSGYSQQDERHILQLISCPGQNWTIQARWVFPVAGPPVRDGLVTIRGEHIVAVAEAGERRADLDLGNVAIVPGLVNAHMHLDLSGLRGLAPPSLDFTAWLRQVIAHRRRRTVEQIEADIRSGLAECLRHGTTLIGDISAAGASWDILESAPIRAVVFHEVLGLPSDRATRAWQDFDRWLAEHPATATCRPGVSAHAPYSVRESLFRTASTAGLPAAIHIAETAEEQELLMHHKGPFVSFLRELGAWAPDGLVDDTARVMRLFEGTTPALFVHGNYLAPDARIPANGTIVYCPRTHAAFGHPSHPFRHFLAREILVALGTDSLASNPDLDMLAEARFVYHRHPDVSGEALLRMITLSGAEALGLHEEAGSIEPGKSADLVVLTLPDMSHVDPYRALFDSTCAPSAVLFRGAWRPSSI